MLKALQNKTVATRVVLGIIVGGIAVSMLVYLVPHGDSGISSPETVADVGGQPVTEAEVRRQMDRITRGGQVPKALVPLYAQQVVNQLVFQRMLEVEAKRLGIRVSQEEQVDRIRQLVPASFVGDSVVGMEQYAGDVQNRFQMSVQEFEELVRQGMLEEKFHRLVTDGVAISPEDVKLEFQRRNEKVKIDYVLIAPDALEAKIVPSDAELEAYFTKNKARYTVPERRVVRYALLDLNQLRQRTQVPEAELRAYYKEHIDLYQVVDRVHLEQILFKTVGKSDAEIQEIQKKAELVLKQAKLGGKFEDLAKKNSEDAATKDKGGDLGWLVRNQASAELDKAAFGLSKGAVSDLIRTSIGFHILKAVDREYAHTKTFEEVRDQIQPILAAQKADQVAADQADKIAQAIRKGGRIPIDDLAKQFSLIVRETAPVSTTDIIPEIGNSPELKDAIFRLRAGELNLPIRTDRGYIVLSVKEIQPTHAGTLAEVRDKALGDYRHEKAVELAKTRADDLAKRVKGGETLSAAAKALGLESKTSEPFARNGNVTGVGSARQLAAAFTQKLGETSAPIQISANWVVLRVAERTEAKPEEFDKQKAEIEQQLLQAKRELAYDAFHNALEDRLKREGLLKFNADTLRRLTNPA
jgi:peptidyl-prolyl cis-trans isomerase D